MKPLMKDRLHKLLRRKWTTPLDALREAGFLSLAQRVSQWRASGVKVADKWVDLGGGRRVKAYKLTT